MWPDFFRRPEGWLQSLSVELVRLLVDISVTGAKALIFFALVLWISGKFGVTGLATLMGKAGVHAS